MRTLEWEDNKLKLIDQTKLPDELTYVYCETYQEVITAIKDMVVRDKVNDEKCVLIARDIKERIENELTYPGQIKVTVIREMRASETAK